MSKKVIETITLLSSDEESPTTVDIMKGTRGEVIIKVEENEPPKSTVQRSTNSDGNHQTNFLKLSSKLPSTSKNTAKSQSTIVSKPSIKPAHNIQSQNKYSIFLPSSVADKTNTSASNTHHTIASSETLLKNSVNKVQHVTAPNNFSEPSQKARKSFSSSKVQNKQNPKLVTVAEDSNNSSKNVIHKNKFAQNTFTPRNSNEHTKILLQKNPSFKLEVQTQNIDKKVNLEKNIPSLKTGENKSKVNSVIDNLKTNSVNTISDIQKSDPEGSDASISIQSHIENSILKYMKNKLEDHSKDSVCSIVLSNAKCNATNNTQTLLKKIPKCLSVTIANKDCNSHSNVSINHNDKDSSILKNESLSSSERKKLNSSLNTMVAGTPNIQMHKKELFFNENHCKNAVISSADSKRKPNYSENSLLTSMPSCKRRKTITELKENVSSVARPDLPVIEISSDGIAHIKKNDKSQTLINNIENDVGKKLPNNHLNESNNITKSPSSLQTMIDVTSVTPSSQNIISEPKFENVNESTIESNYNINKSSNLNEISDEITKDKESNGQNDEKCSKINNSKFVTLNSSLAVQQEIPMEVNDISETPKIQCKQVTSPKLSLKRKRLTEDVAKGDIFFKKGNLFANVENVSIRESENCQESSKDVNESIPSFPIIMDIKSVDKCSTSEEISLKLPNSTINCDSMLSENQQDHSDVNTILPGSSNSTTCAESNREKFEMLLEFCIPKLNLSAEESSKSRQIMYEKFAHAATLYTSSLEFSNFLDMIWEKMEKFPSKRMHHLAELKQELRAYKNSSSKTPDVSISQSNSPHPSNNDNIESAQLPVITESRTNDLQTSVVCVTEVTEEELRSRYYSENSSSDATRVLGNNNTEQKDQARLSRLIKRLEKFLGKLDKKIKKLQATELSLDDLDDEESAYIMEEKYKKKFQKTWELLCRFKNRSARLGSEIEKRFRYDGTRFEKLNRAVEKFMNKRKRTEKFPNYVDILDLIKKTNETLHIGLLENDYQGLAKQVFEDIGRELKKRRKRDIERDFGCFLTDEVKLEDDPAEKDEELKTKLNNSVAEGEKKISEIIENYAVKQETEVDVEEEEESDVSLEPEYHEPNDDLPDTDPATPENTDFPSNENINSPKSDKVTVIDIASDSNASTDPAPDCDNVKIEPVTYDVKSEFDFSNITSKLHKEIETDSDIELPEL